LVNVGSQLAPHLRIVTLSAGINEERLHNKRSPYREMKNTFPIGRIGQLHTHLHVGINSQCIE
jgi:hypothetical protein